MSAPESLPLCSAPESLPLCSTPESLPLCSAPSAPVSQPSDSQPQCSAPQCTNPGTCKCSRCKADYCSAACQLSHWAVHKPQCKSECQRLCQLSAQHCLQKEHGSAVACARAAIAASRQHVPAYLRLGEALVARLQGSTLTAASGTDVYNAQVALQEGVHTLKAQVWVRTHGGSFKAVIEGDIGGFKEGDDTASERALAHALGAQEHTLMDLVAMRSPRSLYTDWVKGCMGSCSYLPPWVRTKVLALCSMIEYREGSRIHGLGVHATRDFTEGEDLFYIDASEEQQRAEHGEKLGTGYSYNDSLIKVTQCLESVTAMLGTLNDAAKPSYDELGRGGGAAAAALQQYAQASAQGVNVLITHPFTLHGKTLMWHLPEPPSAGTSGFMCLRVSAKRAILAGEELTHSYGALRWATEALLDNLMASGGPRARQNLRTLCLAQVERAPQVLAEELGLASLHDAERPGFGELTSQRARMRAGAGVSLLLGGKD